MLPKNVWKFLFNCFHVMALESNEGCEATEEESVQANIEIKENYLDEPANEKELNTVTEDVTQFDYLNVMGTPTDATNMNNYMMVNGKTE